MKIIMANEKLESHALKPFTSSYDRVYVSIDKDEFYENNDYHLSSKNIKKLFDNINHSWDGEIYWFSDKETVLKSLDKWFSEEKNHVDVDDIGISNCFLIKETPHGVCLIDTQLDMSSNISGFLEELNQKFPELTYQCYSDSHLIDNIKLGREMVNNEFELFYFLYQEKVIDASFFLWGLSSFELDDNTQPYYQLLPNDREIVLTGKMAIEREYIVDELEQAGYKCASKVNAKSWLWYGEKVGANKIEAAQAKNITCNSIDEVIEQAYQKYLKNKNNLNMKCSR